MISRLATRTLPVAALMLALSGCGGSDEGTTGEAAVKPSAQSEKTVEAAEKDAQEAVDRYTSGDFAGAWEMSPKIIRDAVPQDDYVRMNETCYQTGAPVEVEGVRLTGDDTASMRLALGGFKDARTLTYEDGLWRMNPSKEFAKQIKDGLTADEMIAAEKKAGTCNGDGASATS